MECFICSLKFKSKANYTKHLKTERHISRSSTTPPNTYSCICGKAYLHSQSLYSHRKTCEKHKNTPPEVIRASRKKSNDNVICIVKQLAQTIQKKDSQIDQLTKQVALLLENAQSNQATTNHTTLNTTNNNDNSTNTTNHIETQNVIVVNSFGNENTEYLTDRIVSKLIANGPFTCLPKIIERIHFDPEHPENHNIKITNQKNNYAKVVKDNKWVTTNKKRAIDAMIQNSYDILEEKYQDNKASIPPFKQERFESFQEKYANQDKELMRNVKDDVDIALLNGTETIYKRGT